MRRRRPRLGLVARVAASALVVAACASDGAVEDDRAAASPPAPAPAPAGVSEVTVLHPFTGAGDAAGFRAIVDAFTAEHPGIRVLAEGSGDFEEVVRARVVAGARPDIILHPRPDLLADLVAQGEVRPLDDVLDRELLEAQLVGGVLDLSTFDGVLYAVPIRLSVKSLVWYSPVTFSANGYSVPTTWDEMIALSDRMVVDGIAPWCIGMESAQATGWVATDWIEDILLRTIGSAAYDRWVAGELAFASEEVRGAIEEYLVPIWTNDAYVHGGRGGIAREAFNDSIGGILGDDPACGMHRQALFIEGVIQQFAPGAEFGEDVDFFLLPSITADDRPVLGGVDYAALYSDDEAAITFLRFLATARSGEGWAARGGFLSPFAPVFDGAVYPTASSVRASEILAQATTFRFDGSDLMHTNVGASPLPGSFWSEMTSWVLEEQTLAQALEDIDAFAASQD